MHVVRHASASPMAEGGVPIFDVAKTLGHSTLQVTTRHVRVAPATGRSAIDALDRRLPPTGTRVIVAATRVSDVRSPGTGGGAGGEAGHGRRLARDSA